MQLSGVVCRALLKTRRFEMRAKIPTASGDWPAFWALGNSSWPHSGEVDMMEYYRNILLFNVMDTKEHWSSTKEPLPAGFSDSYHIWAMDWTPDKIVLSLDGNPMRTYNVNDATVNGYNPFRQPMYLLVNLAIGGTNGGDPSKTAFPQDYSIDYVRVYDTSGSGGGNVGPITSGMTGKCADDYHKSSTNGTIADLYDCNGSAAQQWTVASDGTLQINGKCMDVVGQGSTNGTLVDLWDCNGGANQRWSPQANGSLKSVQSGKCLDDPAASTANGTQLEIWDCNGGSNQKWTLP